jgi:hypothetical protein
VSTFINNTKSGVYDAATPNVGLDDIMYHEPQHRFRPLISLQANIETNADLIASTCRSQSNMTAESVDKHSEPLCQTADASASMTSSLKVTETPGIAMKTFLNPGFCT